MRHIYLIVLVVYISLILGAAMIPEVPKMVKKVNTDKYFHFGEFFLLTLLVIRSLQAEGRSLWLWGLPIIGLTIVTSEVVQLFVLERSFSLWDIAADVAGSISAGVIWWIFLKQ
ncbi:VanZ family protein [Candidatus Woesearchaeota archaeon]|nr:VanZ family protein [Candidatus Woesearchaeota archaeon]